MFLQKLFVCSAAAYVMSSPILFLWFHMKVMKQSWDGDLADRVTVRLYLLSNAGAILLAYNFLQSWNFACPS